MRGWKPDLHAAGTEGWSGIAVRTEDDVMFVQTENREAWRRTADLLNELDYTNDVLLDFANSLMAVDAEGKRELLREFVKDKVGCAVVGMLIGPAMLQVIEVRTQDAATQEN